MGKDSEIKALRKKEITAIAEKNGVAGELLNIIEELVEQILDLLSDDVVALFPAVSIAKAIFKIIKTRFDIHNCDNLNEFLATYENNEAKIDFKQLDKELKLLNDPQERENEIEKLCSKLLDEKEDKSEQYANVLTAFLREQIDKDELRQYISILKTLTMEEISFLSSHKLPASKNHAHGEEKSYVQKLLNKLAQLQLIESFPSAPITYISSFENTQLASGFLETINKQPDEYTLHQKSKKSLDDLIAHMENERGIKFVEMKPTRAKNYLRNTNQYFRVAAYRKNYASNDKDNHNSGKYENLDFLYLTKLCEIDDVLRNQILKMTLDMEKYLKAMLLNHIQKNKREDGYTIVHLYFEKKPEMKHRVSSLYSSDYCRNLVSKYALAECPVWALVELLTFRQLVELIQIYVQAYDIDVKIIRPDYQWFKSTLSLRNAAAHGNCLINDLRITSTSIRSDKYRDTRLVLEELGIPESRYAKLSNRFIFDFINLILLYSQLMPYRERVICLKEWEKINRKHIQQPFEKYFYHSNEPGSKGNAAITSAYNLIREVISKYLSKKDIHRIKF